MLKPRTLHTDFDSLAFTSDEMKEILSIRPISVLAAVNTSENRNQKARINRKAHQTLPYLAFLPKLHQRIETPTGWQTCGLVLVEVQWITRLRKDNSPVIDQPIVIISPNIPRLNDQRGKVSSLSPCAFRDGNGRPSCLCDTHEKVSANTRIELTCVSRLTGCP